MMYPRPLKPGSKEFRNIKNVGPAQEQGCAQRKRADKATCRLFSIEPGIFECQTPYLPGSQSNRSLWHAHLTKRFKGSIIVHLENADSSARRVQRVEEFPIIAQRHIDWTAAFSCESSLCFQQTDGSIPFDAIA